MIKNLTLFLKGVVLGLSMVLPGISGGTMAFIMGIYEKLILEISKTKVRHLKNLFSLLSFNKKRIKKNLVVFKNLWDFKFLLPLLFGVLLSVVLFVKIFLPYIEKHSLQFYALVFGLVLASMFKPFKMMDKTFKTLSLFLLSFTISFFIFLSSLLSLDLSPLNLILQFISQFISGGPWLFVLAGFLVAGALLVPGISGSYLLVIFGLYEKTLQALQKADLVVMGCFFSGAVLGAFLTAKGMQKLIKSYFHETMAVILGLILASLYSVYPLPKKSLTDFLTFDSQKQIFLAFCLLSFVIFMIFSFFYEKLKANNNKEA